MFLLIKNDQPGPAWLHEIRIPDMVTVLCQFENGMEGVMSLAVSLCLRLRIGCKYSEIRDALVRLRFDRITGGRPGEKDAAEIEISPDIEQRWRVEEDSSLRFDRPAASSRNLVLRSESSTCELFSCCRLQSHSEVQIAG
jgi:hypothetical protein